MRVRRSAATSLAILAIASDAGTSDCRGSVDRLIINCPSGQGVDVEAGEAALSDEFGGNFVDALGRNLAAIATDQPVVPSHRSSVPRPAPSSRLLLTLRHRPPAQLNIRQVGGLA
jgi:hypothetical protein